MGFDEVNPAAVCSCHWKHGEIETMNKDCPVHGTQAHLQEVYANAAGHLTDPLNHIFFGDRFIESVTPHPARKCEICGIETERAYTCEAYAALGIDWVCCFSCVSIMRRLFGWIKGNPDFRRKLLFVIAEHSK